jgi:hypothetical protein
VRGERSCTACSEGTTAPGGFSTFLESPWASRAKRRIPIRMVRFCRSTYNVLILVSWGLPVRLFLDPAALCGTAPPLIAGTRRGPVDLDELGVADVSVERVLDGFQVRLVAMCGDMEAPREPGATSLMNTSASSVVRSPTSQVGRSCIRADRGPGPDVAVAEGVQVLLRDVLLLGVAVRPNLVALQALARQVGQGRVRVLGARRAQVAEQSDDDVLRHAGHAPGGPDRHTLNQSGGSWRAAPCSPFRTTIA